MAPSAPEDDTATGLVDALHPLLGYQLRRASTAMLADLTRSLADLDLRPTEASLVLLIADNPDSTQSALGRLLGIQRANMAPLAAALRDRGIVDRARADGRSQALRLSAAGQILVREIRLRVAEHEARYLPGLPARERERLVEMLQRIWMAP